MRADLKKRVQWIEERLTPNVTRILIRCSVRIGEEENDLQQIKKEYLSKHGAQSVPLLFVIDEFLEGDEKPQIFEVRPWMKK